VLLTALCRDIHRAYPGQFELLLNTHFREVFNNNPWARVERPNEKPARLIDINYKEGIRASGKGEKIHMLAWYHKDFSQKTGLMVPVTQPHGDLYLTAEEMQPTVSGRYWVIMAGGKKDVTIKIWRKRFWQETVDLLRQHGITCVHAGAKHKGHIHHTLNNVVDMVGKTESSREMFSLIANAEGVICPITAAMHIAACFNKPCVVIGGGREDPNWEAYTNVYNAFGPSASPVQMEHRYLHTIGLLDCCRTHGCWKHRTVALGNRDVFDKPGCMCKHPVLSPDGPGPECMERITPDHIIEAVMSYYSNGVIPPVGEVKRLVAPSMVQLGGFEPLTQPAEEPPKPEPVVAQAVPRPPVPDPAMIDHPVIGGKLTVMVLCFGDYFELAKSCFESILKTLPVSRLDLRVGLNAVCDRTRDYVNQLPVTKIYDEPSNIKKYPMMSRMFNDPDCPINTKYLVWFDEDAKVVDASMWSQLCGTIVANHSQGCRLYGWVMLHDLQPFAKNGHDPYAWFKAATWWRNKPLWLKGRPSESPNGSVIQFVAGWFWAMATEAIKVADIPDKRLRNNFGDIVLGEQIHQQGWKAKAFNVNKKFVFTPPKDAGGRRGPHEKVLQWQAGYNPNSQ